MKYSIDFSFTVEVSRLDAAKGRLGAFIICQGHGIYKSRASLRLWWGQFSLHRASLIHNLESSVSAHFIRHDQMHHQEMRLLGDSTQPRDGNTIAQCKISWIRYMFVFCLIWDSASLTILNTYVLNHLSISLFTIKCTVKKSQSATNW